MSGIFDIDNKNEINSVNLLNDEWIYEGYACDPLHPSSYEYDWSKIVKLDLGGGYYCYCEFLFDLNRQKIRSIETNVVCKVSSMKSINKFIVKQLDRRFLKFNND